MTTIQLRQQKKVLKSSLQDSPISFCVLPEPFQMELISEHIPHAAIFKLAESSVICNSDIWYIWSYTDSTYMVEKCGNVCI